MLIRIIHFLLFSLIQGQSEPSVGLKENNPRVWALTNALVHTEPGDSIKDCTIIIRDGKIDKVGRYIKIPLDAFEIDMEGSYIYPGFIAINSTLGLVEIDAVRASDDEDEIGEFLPHIRSAIAYNAESKVVESMRPNGVLIAQISPQ